MEIFRQIQPQVYLVAAGILVGLAPSFFDFRSISANGGMRITTAGWIYIATCAAFFSLSIYALYDAKRAEIKKNREDLRAEQQATLNQAVEKGKLQGRFDVLERQNDEILSAIKKSGLEYDSTNGRIIAKAITKASEGFRFTEKELSDTVKMFSEIASSHGVKCITIMMVEGGSNGQIVRGQLSAALREAGYDVTDHTIVQYKEIVNGIYYNINNGCLELSIGMLTR